MTDLENLYQEYEDVLVGKRARISSVYFTQAGSEEIARRYTLALVKYLIEDILKLSQAEAVQIVDEDILKQFKLSFYVKKYINISSVVPLEERMSYIINSCYSEQRINREYIISTYYKLINGECTMPKTFFKGYTGFLRSTICMQAALQRVLDIDQFGVRNPEELYMFFATHPAEVKQFLSDYKLKIPCDLFFGSPIVFLHCSLISDQKNNALYNALRFNELFFSPKKTRKVSEKKKAAVKAQLEARKAKLEEKRQILDECE